MVVPVVVALGGAAIFLNATGTIPVWLPFVLLLWLPGLPILWLTLQSVQTSSFGLAAGRPWRVWEEMPWTLVERVEKRGVALRITGSDGRRLTVVPPLLLPLPCHCSFGSETTRRHVLSRALRSYKLLAEAIPPKRGMAWSVEGGCEGAAGYRPSALSHSASKPRRR